MAGCQVSLGIRAKTRMQTLRRRCLPLRKKLAPSRPRDNSRPVLYAHKLELFVLLARPAVPRNSNAIALRIRVSNAHVRSARANAPHGTPHRPRHRWCQSASTAPCVRLSPGAVQGAGRRGGARGSRNCRRRTVREGSEGTRQGAHGRQVRRVHEGAHGGRGESDACADGAAKAEVIVHEDLRRRDRFQRSR